MAETSAPRIGPGDRSQIGLLNAAIVRAISLRTGGRRFNIFPTLARHRGLFRRWLWFAGGLMPGGKLPRRDSELVILRVAHNTGSEYEWSHHERIGRWVGLTEDEIARVRDRAGANGWAPRQALLLEAVDALHADRDLGDELWERLAGSLDKVELIELCMLVGHYEMLAMTLGSLRVQRDF